MIRRPPRSTLSSSSAASDVYKRQVSHRLGRNAPIVHQPVKSGISCCIGVSGCFCPIGRPCNSTFSHLKRRSKRGIRGDFIRSLGSHEQRSGNGSAGKRGLLLRHPIGRGRHLPTPRALRHTTCTAVVTVSIVNFETVTEIFRLATGCLLYTSPSPRD